MCGPLCGLLRLDKRYQIHKISGIYTPCKIYHDYHKYKHEADQERVTVEVKMVEDKNSPQDTTEEIESILTTLEAIVIRLEMLESRPTYLPSKRLLALNN